MSLKGLATGIGSLPFNNPEEALDLIFQYTPQMPFWPQLPKRDIREGMTAQFSENLPCLKATKEGLIFDGQKREEELEAFYDRIIRKDKDYFKISRDYALGLHSFYQRLQKSDLRQISFIKCHITGPFTFGASISDEKGIALLYDTEFMQVVLNSLMLRAAWQLELFKGFGKKLVIFFDEPYLGCFGSGYTPLTRESVVSGLTDLTAGLKEFQEVLIGVHCCGNTDWSMLAEVKTIDIISFDAFGFQERFVLYAENIKDFIKRGGIICWGVVPTEGFSGMEKPRFLLEKIVSAVEALVKKGVDKDLLLDNLIISPSCGLGALDIKKSEGIFRLLSDVSACLKESL